VDPAASYFDPQTNISMPLASVWSKIVAMPMPTLPCSAKARRTLCPAGQDRARLPGHGLIILGPGCCLLVLANLLCLRLAVPAHGHGASRRAAGAGEPERVVGS
jgi:hypothetical protein